MPRRALPERCLQSYNDKQARKYLVPDWCTFDEARTISIKNGETIEWFGAMDVFGNLIVGNNSTLIVQQSSSLKIFVLTVKELVLSPLLKYILTGFKVSSFVKIKSKSPSLSMSPESKVSYSPPSFSMRISLVSY